MPQIDLMVRRLARAMTKRGARKNNAAHGKVEQRGRLRSRHSETGDTFDTKIRRPFGEREATRADLSTSTLALHTHLLS